MNWTLAAFALGFVIGIIAVALIKIGDLDE